MQESLLHILQKRETLAKASKWSRLLNNPAKYVNGQLFSKLIYPLNKKGKLVSADTFFGSPMQLLLPAGMDIYLLGAKSHDSEIRLTRFLIKNLKAGDSFLDVGAHYGFYSLLAAHLCGKDGRVMSIEASEAIYQILQKNLKSQNNIELFHLAAHEENSHISFFEFPILFSEYNTIHPEQFEKEKWYQKNQPKEVKVPSKRLDSFTQEHNFLPHIIKIDVEGAEDKVINGLSELLQAASPILAMEYLGGKRANKAHQESIKQLLKYGYEAHIIQADGSLHKTADPDQHLLIQEMDSDNIILKKAN